MMKSPCVYQMIFPNGKRYIGVAKDAGRRRAEHFRNARNGGVYPVHQAIRKYGHASVQFVVMLHGPYDYCLEMERRSIEQFNSRAPNGYNVSFGGDTAPSKSPQVRARLKETSKENWKRPEYREKIIAAAKAFRPNAEQRRRNGEAKKKAWQDPIYRQKCVDGHIGHKQSDLTKARRGDSLRKAWAAGKGRDARSKAMSGRVWANDGVQHRQFRPGETIPGGWVRGMIKKGRP